MDEISTTSAIIETDAGTIRLTAEADAELSNGKGEDEDDE